MESLGLTESAPLSAGDRQPNPKDFGSRSPRGTQRSCERGCETADTEGEEEEEEVAPFPGWPDRQLWRPSFL